MLILCDFIILRLNCSKLFISIFLSLLIINKDLIKKHINKNSVF